MTTTELYDGCEIVLEEYLPSSKYSEKRNLEWEVEKYFMELNRSPFRMKNYAMCKDSEKIVIFVSKQPKLSDYAVLPFKFLLFIVMGIVLVPYYLLRNFLDWIFNGSAMEHFVAQMILVVAVPIIGIYIAQPYIDQGFVQLAQTVKIIHDARVQVESL